MANNLSAFLKQNVITRENEKFVVSQRFVQDGKPVEWEICAITSAEDEELRKKCMKRVPVPGKRNVYQPEFDSNTYLAVLAASCTVFPDLNNAELQDSYGVKGADKLIKAMLTAGEFYDYMDKIQEINGFDVSMDDKVEEAKN